MVWPLPLFTYKVLSNLIDTPFIRAWNDPLKYITYVIAMISLKSIKVGLEDRFRQTKFKVEIYPFSYWHHSYLTILRLPQEPYYELLASVWSRVGCAFCGAIYGIKGESWFCVFGSYYLGQWEIYQCLGGVLGGSIVVTYIFVIALRVFMEIPMFGKWRFICGCTDKADGGRFVFRCTR